jgi:hypothetical protein
MIKIIREYKLIHEHLWSPDHRKARKGSYTFIALQRCFFMGL